MRIQISEHCYLEASKSTCERVLESFRIFESLKTVEKYEEESWIEYFDDIEYRFERINKLLGLE